AQRKTFFGVFDSGAGDFLEAHGAPLFQDRQRGVNRARNNGRIESSAVQRFVARFVPVDAHGARRPALTHDGGDLSVLLWIDENQRLASKTVKILFEDATGKQRCGARIKRVPTFEQNLKGGGGRQWMTRGDAGSRAHHGRTKGRTG